MQTIEKLKANELLKSFLTSKQRKDWDDKRWFEIRGSAGHVYRLCGSGVCIGTVQRVWPLGLRFKRRCFQSRERLPTPDVILAAKIWIETNEKEFLRMIRGNGILRIRFLGAQRERGCSLPWDLPLR